MENYHSGEIILVSFPFSDAIGTKRRPALVIFAESLQPWKRD